MNHPPVPQLQPTHHPHRGIVGLIHNQVHNLTATYIKPVSQTLVSELRFGYQRMKLHRDGERANGEDLIGQLGITGVGFGGPEAYGLPRFDVQGQTPFGDSLLCTPCQYDNNNFQVGERITWSAGKHSVRVGGDARKFNWDMLGFFQNRGYFQFTSPITSRPWWPTMVDAGQLGIVL